MQQPRKVYKPSRLSGIHEARHDFHIAERVRGHEGNHRDAAKPGDDEADSGEREEHLRRQNKKI